MLGDAIQQGNTSTSKEALFDEYYRRSYEHSWKNPPIDDAHYYFLGLTSIGVAINPKRLQSYQALDLFPKINDINQQFLRRLEINYNNEEYSNTAVDLMAEYFVLKHIISDDCSIIQTRNGKLWLNCIWQDLPEVAEVFTARCLLDFPELAQGLLDLEDPRYLNRIADVLLYLTATTGNKAKCYYDILEKLADKHQQQEIDITQAKALVNLVNDYGKTNPGKAKDYYDILKELADKHQHQGIYIIQATALVNLVGDYGKTDLDKARYYYDLLEKLADKHQHQEIYITQAKALVNLGVHYGKTDLDKARYYYDLLEKLADKHQHQEIYITQATVLDNLVGNYCKTDLDKAKDCYQVLAGLADRKKIEEINLMQLKILGYWSQEKLLPNSELGVLIGQYLQRWWGGKIQVSDELLKWLEEFTFVLIAHYSTNKQDKSDFNQAINNFTNGMEKIQYCLDKIHAISQQLITEEIL
jgi:hypothetical protein